MLVLIAQIFTLIVLIALLVKSADLVEDSFQTLSKVFKINSFILGFVFLSVASSLPEISVAISSSVQQVPDLSLGNLLGATLVLLTLVVGMSAIKQRSIPFGGFFGRWEVFLCMTYIVGGLGVLYDQRISFVDGLILIGLYMALILFLVRKSKRAAIADEHFEISRKESISIITKTILGLFGLIIFSNIIVSVTVDIAESLSISETLIGLVMLGVGTNLPEITILIRSHGVEKEKMAIGNFIGSAVINLATLGILGVLIPHNVDNFDAVVPVLSILVASCLIFAIVAWTNNSINRFEGMVLVALFVIFLLLEGVSFAFLL